MAVTLEILKAHLNITHDLDDSLLTQKLAAATAWVASYIGEDVTDETPAPVDEAIMQLAGHLYENREASIEGAAELLPFSIIDLLAPYRAWVF